MTDDRTTELDERWVAALRRAGPEVAADAAAWEDVVARAGTARPHRRARVLVAAAVLAVAAAVGAVVVVAGDDEGRARVQAAQPTTTADPVAPQGSGVVPVTGEWQRLASPPLSPRSRRVTVWTGTELLAIGGDTWTCPPNADCVGPEEPPLRDGAALDPATGRWRTIADAPVPLASASTAVVGDDVYLLTLDGPALLRYSVADDAWDELDPPTRDDDLGWYQLVAAGDRLVAVSGSDEIAVHPDLVLDPASDEWEELPADPLPASFDRNAVWLAPHLYLFGKEDVPQPGSEEPALVLAARLDLATGEWTRLPDSEIIGGYGPWLPVGDLLVAPASGGADGGGVGAWGRWYPDGGVLDTASLEWRPLPGAPPAEARWVGAFGGGGAAYGAPEGQVLDLERGAMVTMPALPGAAAGADREVAAAGTAAVVVGGVRWGEDEPEILDDVWIWRPA